MVALRSGALLAALLVFEAESFRAASKQEPQDSRRRRDEATKAAKAARRAARAADRASGSKAPKAPISTTTPEPRDIGPVYKCETVPTANIDKHLTCSQDTRKPWKDSQGQAACFSLLSTMKWFCPKDKVAPNWFDISYVVCVKKRDRDSNLYDGRCVHKNHKDYAKAVDYDGAGKLLKSRLVRKPTIWDPNAPLWYNEPRYKLDQPRISSNAIGWNPTDTIIAEGKWCQIGQPPKGWSPGQGLCQHTGTKVRVLSYNLYWWKLFGDNNGFASLQNSNGGWDKVDRAAGRLMEKNGPYDLMGFQECDKVERIIKDARMSSTHATYKGRNAIAIAWRKDTWKSLQSGYEDVAEDYMKTDWSGRRGVVWSRLQNKKTGQLVFFMNHHGPLPDNSGGYCGPHAYVYQILRVIAERAHKGDTVIFVGDFNSMGASTVTNVLDQHLKNSYHGKSFDGVDKFYHNCAESVKVAKKENLGQGGSDHDALAVTYEI